MTIRFDYEEMEDNPGLCRIRRCDDGQGYIKDLNPQKEVYEENVPKSEVIKRLTELDTKFNRS